MYFIIPSSTWYWTSRWVNNGNRLETTTVYLSVFLRYFFLLSWVVLYFGYLFHWSVLEQGSEHKNKIVRYNREHHARQFSLQLGLYDAFLRDCHGSSPKILRIIEESINRNPELTELHLSQSVIALLETTDDTIVSTDSEMSDDSSVSGDFFIQPSN